MFNQNKHKRARTDIWNEAEEQEEDGGDVDGNAEARADDSLVYGVGQLARHLVTQGQTTVHEEPDGRNGDHQVDWKRNFINVLFKIFKIYIQRQGYNKKS